MTPFSLLVTLLRDGIDVSVRDGKLRIEGDNLTDAIIANLKSQKSELLAYITPTVMRAIALLSKVDDDDDRLNLIDEFDERAAILEYDAGSNREVAERVSLGAIQKTDRPARSVPHTSNSSGNMGFPERNGAVGGEI